MPVVVFADIEGDPAMVIRPVAEPVSRFHVAVRDVFSDLVRQLIHAMVNTFVEIFTHYINYET